MKKILRTSLAVMCLLIGVSLTSNAQFIADSSQTYFICNAAGSQSGVSAFGDGIGGSYSFWIDKRNGAGGTAIYGQHLDSIGFPQWPVNGKLFFQENAKEIWLMKAVAWQNGILIGWIQAPFSNYGDTLYCNYYNLSGVSQWAQPAVLANKQAGLSVNYDDMDIYPNDSGATITFGLLQNGGNNYFSFNRIDFSGNLRWPLDSFSYQGNGYYYHTGYDNHNGFYVATSTGGLGYDIYLGHFDLQGNLTIPTPIDVCGTAGGRGNSQWKVLCDNDTNAYIVWASYANSDISISKIKPNGTLAWSNAKSVCGAAGLQDIPEATIRNDSIYVIWDDSRPGSIGNYDIYMQKLDTAGNPFWIVDGILVSHLSSYIPYPKITSSGAGTVATYVVNGGFRGQKIRPDTSSAWHQNGILVNVPNPPFYGDYQLVPASTGSVVAIWRESGDNICAARIRANGTLTAIAEQEENTLALFPNPANEQFTIQLKSKNKEALISIYNQMGGLVFQKKYHADAKGSIKINTRNLVPGYYFVMVTAGNNYQAGEKINVVR